MPDKILTPQEFDLLEFIFEREEAYERIHKAYTAAMKRIEVLKTYGQIKRDETLRLTARLEQQDAIIAGAAKTMATLSDVVSLTNPELDDEELDEIDGSFDVADVLSALDIPIVGQVDPTGRIVLDHENRGAI